MFMIINNNEINLDLAFAGYIESHIWTLQQALSSHSCSRLCQIIAGHPFQLELLSCCRRCLPVPVQQCLLQ